MTTSRKIFHFLKIYETLYYIKKARGHFCHKVLQTLIDCLFFFYCWLMSLIHFTDVYCVYFIDCSWVPLIFEFSKISCLWNEDPPKILIGTKIDPKLSTVWVTFLIIFGLPRLQKIVQWHHREFGTRYW